jgi:hypothetical protein
LVLRAEDDDVVLDSRTGAVSYPIGMSSFSTFKAGIQLVVVENQFLAAAF